MAKVVIISGATSENSRLNGIELEVEAFLTRQRIEYEQIKVRDLPPEDLIYGKFDSPEIVKANKKVESADAVIVLTPVYKASFTGVLKTYLDLLPQKGFANKIILPLVIGGTYGHLLVIDYALKPVLSALGATTILSGVYTLDSQVERIGDHQFQLDTEIHERLQKALTELSGQLAQVKLN
ncbi:FMN reductase (NADPH) [Bacillus methanolicus]|uniref:NADPH-dependent FMN reductase n=1 Tax=Bacillus methanolicus TaxID=1471 RepID=UPI00200C81CD|nr:NADPH-dependent FMN reductase [Bacillus methanolicus]UQD52198.1 FMN reductase (NADPH) [Bacillus methanolicus]